MEEEWGEGDEGGGGKRRRGEEKEEEYWSWLMWYRVAKKE